METLDGIIVLIISAGAIMGFTKGFIKQLASMVGLIAGLLLARALFASVGKRLALEIGSSVSFGQIIAFILIWLIVPIGLSLTESLLTKVINAIQLGIVNRWLGAGLGAIKYALLTSMAIYFIDYADAENAWVTSTKKTDSMLYYPMKNFSGIFIPTIKNVTKQLIDTDICNKNPINM